MRSTIENIRPLMEAKRQRGTAIVEFMIVAPLLLLLVIVVAEFARLIQHNEILNQTVRNASRYAAEQTLGSLGTLTLTPALILDIQELAVYGQTAPSGTPMLPGMTIADVSVSQPNAEHVQVTANYTYQALWGGTVPSFGLGSGGDFSVPLTTVMRTL